MSTSQGGPQARVIPILCADELPCPVTLRERKREELFPPYKAFAEVTRGYRRAVFEAKALRQTASNPLSWLRAGLYELEMRLEHKLAARWQATVAQGLDHARVNTALGWTMDYQPSCQESASPSLTRRAAALMTSAALVITPAKADHLPLTPEQKGDWLAYMALCSSGNGKRPDMPAPPCHAPKMALRNEGKTQLA